MQLFGFFVGLLGCYFFIIILLLLVFNIIKVKSPTLNC